MDRMLVNTITLGPTYECAACGKPVSIRAWTPARVKDSGPEDWLFGSDGKAVHAVRCVPDPVEVEDKRAEFKRVARPYRTGQRNG